MRKINMVSFLFLVSIASQISYADQLTCSSANSKFQYSTWEYTGNAELEPHRAIYKSRLMVKGRVIEKIKHTGLLLEKAEHAVTFSHEYELNFIGDRELPEQGHIRIFAAKIEVNKLVLEQAEEAISHGELKIADEYVLCTEVKDRKQ